MTVPFSNIPSNLRVPLFYAEVDNSQANGAQMPMRRLIVGQVNDDASHEDHGRLVIVSRTSDAIAIGGAGSVLARMHELFRKNDPFGEIWCLPVKLEVGTAASATVTVTGAALEAGVLSLYYAGQRVQVLVTKGAAAAEVATAVAASINAAPALPIKATALDGVVTVTAKFKGALGNDVRLQLNRLGRANGEVTPSGLTVALTEMAGGAGAPEMADVLAALGDEYFEFIVQPWTDTASLDAWQETMNDTAGRWSWAKQIYGHVYTARRGTLGALVAAGRLRNDQHMTMHGFEMGVPQASWEVAAAYTARTAVFISADPAAPTQSGALTGIDPAEMSARFMLTERQSLLESGIATAFFEGGAYRIDRAVTTYQKNPYGQADDSYLDSEPLHQSAYVLRDLRTAVTSKYGRHKLANDGTNLGAGGRTVTPKVIRGELIARYRKLEREGIVENTELFKQHLIVERNANNPNRLDVLYPPDLVNQLRIFALLYQFRLQYPAEA